MTHTNQALYHMSHAPSPFVLYFVFEMEFYYLCLYWPGTHDPPVSDPWVMEITDMHYRSQLSELPMFTGWEVTFSQGHSTWSSPGSKQAVSPVLLLSYLGVSFTQTSIRGATCSPGSCLALILLITFWQNTKQQRHASISSPFFSM
jgi:hypothetical protein